MNLVAFMFQCLSSERSVVHNVYMVFENKPDGEFIESPCSYCGCENGAFFCSHMLAFFYVARGIQVPNRDMSQEEFEEMMPEDRRITQTEPCLLENIMVRDKIKRQEGQSKRQAKKNNKLNNYYFF